MQTVKRDISRILPYSAINRNANSPPPYSILNPETSSDSPSAKSKGARFVSARDLINHIVAIGQIIKTNHIVWQELISERLNVSLIIRMVNKIKAILTSYEIVCAIARVAPRREYFELDAHPDSSVA